MITYKDIRRAINRKLKTTGIEINSKDVWEGFIRPSFFVQLDNVNRSGDENQVHKSMTVQLYFFPTDRYEYAIEVLDMQETLENLFDLKLPIKDRLINVDEFNTVIVDGILNCSFDLAFYDGREFAGNENTIVDEMEIDKSIAEGKDYGPDVESGEDYYTKFPIEPMEILDITKE